jgi:hypothetical protein
MRRDKYMFKSFFFMQYGIFALVFCLTGCIESSFELAPESRLPSCFDAPAGLTRGDLKVTLDYYTNGQAVFKLYKKGSLLSLQEAKGTSRGNKPIQLKNPPKGFPKHYPMYQIITVDGKTDVIEHRKMEPIFYITDDPDILRELDVAGP